MVRGCSDHSNDLNMSCDSLTTHRPPQPLIINTCSSKYSFSLAEAPPAGHVSKEGYRDSDIAQAPVSSRWNPTPEQVEVLKEMYRLGTRTPTAEHIQQITTLLRRFGRVEGKNIFYWFQNHKARERQRRRRERVETSSQEQKCNVAETRERKKSGLRKACCEVEESSNWLPLPISKCNSLSEEHVSAHRPPSSANGWTQFEEREFHRIKTSTVHSRDMWLHMMELPSPMSFMSTTSKSSLTLKPTASTEDHGNQARQYQTLELFPLQGDSVSEKQSQASITTMNTSFRPNQFVEYLPPKVSSKEREKKKRTTLSM